MEAQVYRCAEGQQPLDLWHDLLTSLDIDERAIGTWSIDRQVAREWNVRRLFRYGKASTSKAVLAIREALNDPNAEIYEIENLRGQRGLYVGVSLTAIAAVAVRR